MRLFQTERGVVACDTKVDTFFFLCLFSFLVLVFTFCVLSRLLAFGAFWGLSNDWI